MSFSFLHPSLPTQRVSTQKTNSLINHLYYYAKNYSWFGILFFLSLIPFYTPQQGTPWVFKKSSDGIKIYTREAADSNIKELKFTVSINSTMNNAIAMLIDVENYAHWVYKCKESVTLEEINIFQSYCYYNIDFPWPMSDRDMIVYSEVSQDPNTKTVTSNSYGNPKYILEKEGLVRIHDHFNQWVFKPISADQIEITYLLKSDPAGSIPDWMVNMAIDQGPLKSMKGFMKALKNPQYKNATVPGILDW